MRFTISAVTLAALMASGAAPARAGEFTPGERPPVSAQPGQCFGRVTAPGGSSRHVERVLVRAAHIETRREAPVTRWTERRRLVRAAWTQTITHPAIYRTEVDHVVEPGRRRVVRTPARYRRVVERVLVSPARVVWRPGRAAGGFGGGGPGATHLTPTGEVMCRVKIPARYATRVRHVLVSPGCACEVVGPPVRRRVTRRVLVTPARTERREHPAVYRTERVCEIVSPGRAYSVRVPAQYRTVAHVRHHERAGWAPVVCPNGLAPWAMSRLQAQLNAQGYAAGPEDGQGRAETYGALTRWQRDHGLAAGQITVESARALGVVR